MLKGGEAFLATIEMVGETETPDLGNIPVAAEYADVFELLRGPPPQRNNAFTIELEPGTAPVSRAPYRLAPAEMAELKKQLEELVEKGFIRPSSSPWGAHVLFPAIGSAPSRPSTAYALGPAACPLCCWGCAPSAFPLWSVGHSHA